MSGNNPKRSVWARLFPDGKNGVQTVNVDDLIAQGIADAAPLREELEDRLTRLQENGVVSISMNFQRGGMTTLEGMASLNNVIRQYEEGAGEFKTIPPSPERC